MKLSLLLPTRNRPQNLHRLADSVIATTDNLEAIELIVFIDDDDLSYDQESYPEIVKIFKTARTLQSIYWNLAYEKSTGDIVMQCADDIIFQTKGWDTTVKEAFKQYPDGIVFIYGDDGDPNKDKNYGTHGFVHRNWVEAVGYFTAPYFSSDFSDTWLNEVADMIGRKVKVDILTEHMHPAFLKGPLDLTHAERLVRHWKDDTPAIYASKLAEREADADKLRKVMND